MHTFWLTFRLADSGKFAERLDRLMRLLHEKTEGVVWQEPTSFILFKSNLDIAALARHLSKAISKTEDLLLIGTPDGKAARLVGTPKNHSIYALLPFVEDV